MSFDGFLGNNTIKDRLKTAAASGKLAHSYLICGPEGSGRKTLARLLAAAMECTGDGEKPCCRCDQCRKVLSDNHPDVIWVTDDAHKDVAVRLVREKRAELYIRPNEGKRKVFIFPQSLNDAGQNSQLKVMEEPPAYGAFILLCKSAQSLLPTVRSRCVELNLSPVPWQQAQPWLQQRFPHSDGLRTAYDRAGGFLGAAAALLQEEAAPDPRVRALAGAFAQGDTMALTQELCRLEKCKRDQLIPVLRQLQTMLAQAMVGKNCPGADGAEKELCRSLSAARLLEGYQVVKTSLEAAEANVGTGHICGYLSVKLR